MTATTARYDVTSPTFATLADESFEVATTSSDAVSAVVRTAGPLTRETCAVLIGVLHTHLRAGRRELQVDFADSAELDESVLAVLVGCYRHVSERGGTLVFVNAAPRLMGAIDDSSPLVQSAR